MKTKLVTALALFGLLLAPILPAAELTTRLSIHAEPLTPSGQKIVDMYGTQRGPIECRVFFKDGASRTEMPANSGPALAGQIILGTAGGQIHQLSPAVQAYTTWPRNTAPVAKATAHRPGRTQTISGYACELVAFDLGGGEKFEFWVTKDLTGLGAMDVADNTLDARRRALFQQLNGVPIRIVHTTANYRLTQEFTEIKPGPLDAALFEIPAGYRHEKDGRNLMKKPAASPGSPPASK
jgi:hypothetical protein